jgi:hypothetical protein
MADPRARRWGDGSGADQPAGRPIPPQKGKGKGKAGDQFLGVPSATGSRQSSKGGSKGASEVYTGADVPSAPVG